MKGGVNTGSQVQGNRGLQASWQAMWSGLGASGDGRTLADELALRYSEPWRRYHTLEHLGECLGHFAPVQHLARQPAEVAAALWFHDAVYDIGAADNEERSARWALIAMTEYGVDAAVADRVAQLVLVTRHTSLPVQPDEQLLVDIDLSILGAPPARFAAYENQIRAEYAIVEERAFKARRRAVLQSFLARPRIYSTDHFYALLENAARANLAGSLAQLAP